VFRNGDSFAYGFYRTYTVGANMSFFPYSFNITIKVALAHPAASNWVCSRHRSGYNGTIKNRLFSFAYMLLFLLCFPDFQLSF